jgi:hypothetical protein
MNPVSFLLRFEIIVAHLNLHHFIKPFGTWPDILFQAFVGGDVVGYAGSVRCDIPDSTPINGEDDKLIISETRRFRQVKGGTITAPSAYITARIDRTPFMFAVPFQNWPVTPPGDTNSRPFT